MLNKRQGAGGWGGVWACLDGAGWGGMGWGVMPGVGLCGGLGLDELKRDG